MMMEVMILLAIGLVIRIVVRQALKKKANIKILGRDF